LSDARGPHFPDADAQLGDLFIPWSWGGLNWRYFGRNAGGAWRPVQATPVPGTSQTLHGQDVADLGNAVRSEVKSGAVDCEYPFSQGMDDFWSQGKRSYVHALAPLTHWPALVSEKVLQLSFFVAIAPAELAGLTNIVAFPEFDITPTPLLKSAQIRLKAGAPPLAPPNNPLTNGSKLETVATYQDASVGFHGLAASTTDVAFKTGGPVMSQGLATRAAIRDGVQDFLLPAQVLRRWLQKEKLAQEKPQDQEVDDAELRKALTRALWQALGIGREPRPDEENVLELFLKPDQASEARMLRKALHGFTMTDAAASDALVEAARVLKGDRATQGAPHWSADDKKRWELRFPDFEQVTGKPVANTMFSVAWASVTEMVLGQETGLEIYGPWLAHALGGALESALGADWTPIKDKLLAPGGMRADLMGRARGSGISQDQWTTAKAIVGSLDPAQAKGSIDEATLVPLVDATLKNIETTLNSAAAYAAIKAGLEPVVKEAVGHWADHMQETIRRARRRPRDRGIRLDFTQLAGMAGNDVQTLRGYAISLCSGVATDSVAWVADTARAAWLTDTALRYKNVGVSDWLNTQGGAGTAWLHETVGATYNDGELLLSVEYEGSPLAAPLTEDNDAISYEPGQDGFQSVELAWRKSVRALPLLGYGMLYKATATAIDNAGGVVDKDFRRASNEPAELADPGTLQAYGDGSGALHYRSSEPPGAPVAKVLPEASLYELSEETQAHAYQHRQGADRPAKVALFAHDTRLFPSAKTGCTIAFKPPKAQFTFIERWINTDRVLIEKGLKAAVSDARLADFASDSLAKFVETFRERIKDGLPVPVPDYHPAVAAIGIEVTAPGYQKAAPIQFARLDLTALKPADFELMLEVKTADSGIVDMSVNGNVATVIVPQGRFACVRVYSLVSAEHFKADGLASCRFVDGIQLSAVNGLQGWCAFGPAEYWFETIPHWDENGFKNADATLRLNGPSEQVSTIDKGIVIASPNLVTAEIEFDGAPWVNWVKGIYAQRHDWHWTGYPVEFPAPGERLDKWLPSLAGVESFREIVDVPLSTSFAGGAKWVLGPTQSNREVFFRHELTAGRRPARYVAVFGRPMVRFRRWLNPKLTLQGPASLESRIWGGGLLVPGRAESGSTARLPAPVLRHSIPLTATYASSLPFVRETNGAMLVFDEAIRRTDDLAQLGGVGDILEVDLVETRVPNTPEIGNNPIFHGASGPWSAKKPLKLDVKPPFGLTFDIGTNAKVAQTALVVQPVNAGGNWILSKARVRRVVLPETELGSRVETGAPPQNPDPAMKGWYSLTSRTEGDDAVPPDVVLDVAPQGVPQVRLRIDGKDKVLTLPMSGGAGTRYMISWHKVRWSDGEPLPAWRCQVLAQVPEPGTMTWRTVDKASGHDNAASELPHGWREAGVKLGVDLTPAQVCVRRIRLSNYTDPVWLTFIGSFGQEMLGTPDLFLFYVGADGSLDLRLREGVTAVVPQLRGLDDCLADTKDPRWHLILAFRAAKDVTRGKAGREGGVLVGAYWKRGGTIVRLPQAAGDPAPYLAGCRAHIITLQRVTALSAEEENGLKLVSTLPDLLDKVFPDQSTRPRESIMRFLPEYLGPIDIATKD
jgi:hypothetical protein